LGDMADGTVSLAPLGESIPADVKALVASAQDKIIKGELDVFAGPLKDQSGAEKVASGASLAIGDVLGMNWFVAGVVGKIPQ